MVLPVPLTRAVEQAHIAVLENTQHTLLPIYRLSVYNSVGPMTAPLGYRFRATEGLLTARYVLTFWEHVWPGNPLPSHVLQLAERMLAGTLDPDNGGIGINGAWERLEDHCAGNRTRPQNAACVAAEAAVTAAFTAARIDPFEGVEINASTADRDLDPWSCDTAQWAAWAFVEGTPDSLPEEQRRLQFWEWWLLEAIPKAWEIAR